MCLWLNITYKINEIKNKPCASPNGVDFPCIGVTLPMPIIVSSVRIAFPSLPLPPKYCVSLRVLMASSPTPLSPNVVYKYKKMSYILRNTLLKTKEYKSKIVLYRPIQIIHPHLKCSYTTKLIINITVHIQQLLPLV